MWLMYSVAANLFGALSALKESVDYRTEVIDEVRIGIKSASGLSKGVTLAVKHNYRGKLREFTAESLERGLIAVAQYGDRRRTTGEVLKLIVGRFVCRVDAYPINLHVLALVSFGQ